MMKKYIYILGIVCLSIGIIISCTDEDLTKLDDLQSGVFVKHATTPETVIGVNDLADFLYETTLIDPAGTVASYELYIYGDLVSSGTSDTILINTYKEFPIEISYNVQGLATQLGIDVSAVGFGDTYNFIGIATDVDGNKYYAESSEILDDTTDVDSYETYYTRDSVGNVVDTVYLYSGGLTSSVLLDGTTGYNNGFDFSVTIGCPSNSYSQDEVAGTYTTTNNGFYGMAASNPVVVAGPEENQFTIKDLFEEGYDIVVDVDPETNELTVSKQEAATDWSGYGLGSVEGSGTIFQCAGFISLNLEHTVSAGSFGTKNTIISK
jgi:hypothetical protein